MRPFVLGLCAALALAGCIRSGANVTPTGAAAVAQPVGGLSAQVLGEVNAFRASNDAFPVAADARLAAAAMAHAQDMAQNGFFAHAGSDGSSVGDRVKRQGYGFCFVAENIAKGQRSAEAALAGWKTSQGHRENMISGFATQMGMAQSGDVWVMVLGKPGC